MSRIIVVLFLLLFYAVLALGQDLIVLPAKGQSEVAPESVGMPQFFIIDFDKKETRATTAGMSDKTSQVERLEHVDGKLIIQGAEDGDENIPDGLGWTLAISEETGKWVLSASGDQVAFIAYGACMPWKTPTQE